MRFVFEKPSHGGIRRVALFGRKIHFAESPIEIVRLMREVVARTVSPSEAVKAYHAALQKRKIAPARGLVAVAVARDSCPTPVLTRFLLQAQSPR